MSAIDLMNQSCIIYPKSGYNAQGRATVGSGQTWQCRAQATTKNIRVNERETKTIDLILYLPPDAPIELDYKITYNSADYKVFRHYPTPNGDGDIEFIKAECIKWQA